MAKIDKNKYRFDLVDNYQSWNVSAEKLKTKIYRKFDKKTAAELAGLHVNTFDEKWAEYYSTVVAEDLSNLNTIRKYVDDIYDIVSSFKDNKSMSYYWNDPNGIWKYRSGNDKYVNSGYIIPETHMEAVRAAYSIFHAEADTVSTIEQKIAEIKSAKAAANSDEDDLSDLSDEEAAEATKNIGDSQNSDSTSSANGLSSSYSSVEETKAKKAAIKDKLSKFSSTAGTYGGILANYIATGDTLGSAKAIYESLTAGKSGFVSKVLSSVGGFVSGVQSAISGAMSSVNTWVGNIDSAISGWADGLISKLPGPLNKLASKYGLRSGILDFSFQSALGSVMSMATNALGSLASMGMNYLTKEISVSSGYDDAILGLVKSLCYTGGDVNYNGTFLKYILMCDWRNCLIFLDSKNGTVYTLEGKEYSRAFTAAYNGCVKVPKYICDRLYILYKMYNTESKASGKTEEEVKAAADKAKQYAETIAMIFKTVVVYAYSNLTESDVRNWYTSFSDIINPSILGTTDNKYNGKFLIGSSDINVMAPIITLTEANSDGWSKLVSADNVGGFGGQSLSATDQNTWNNLNKQKQYIDPRNMYVKRVYSYLVGNIDVTIPESDRMVNADLYERLKLSSVSLVSKSVSDMYSILGNSKAFKGLKNIAGNVAGGTIANTLDHLYAINIIIPVSETKASNLNIGFEASAFGTDSIPDFIDYSSTKIEFRNYYLDENGNNDFESYIKTVKYGEPISIPSCEFKKEGYHLDHWVKIIDGSETTTTYEDEAVVTFNTNNIILKAEWVEGDIDDDGDTDDSEGGAYTPISIIDLDDIKSKSRELCLGVSLIDEFSRYNMSLKDFDVIENDGAKTEEEILDEYSNLDVDDTPYKVDELVLYKLDEENKYTKRTSFYIYSGNSEIFKNESLTENDKEKIIHFIVTSYLVTNYSYKYETSFIANMFGTSTDSGANTPNKYIAEYITYFDTIIADIKQFVLENYDRQGIIVTFNCCGHGGEENSKLEGVKFMSHISEKDAPILEDDEFTFDGWYADHEYNDLWRFDTDYVIREMYLFAKWTPKPGTRYAEDSYQKKLNINYFDKGNVAFSGSHGDRYPSSFYNTKNVKLDTPKKSSQTFMGYYDEPKCNGEMIEYIYAYTKEENVSLYTRWIDNNEYFSLENGFTYVFGIPVYYTNLAFYTSYAMADKKVWKLGDETVDIYNANGERISKNNIPSVEYTPNGITSVSNGKTTAYLLLVRKNDGKLYLYATKDKIDWQYIMECTYLNFNVFDICGAESVLNLMFTRRVIYNSILLTVTDDDKKIIVNENDEKILFDVDDSLEVCRGKTVLGMCTTITGKLYILVNDVGVLVVDNFDEYISSGGNTTLVIFGIAGWKEGLYNVNNTLTGTPNSATGPFSTNDQIDFDINDEEYLKHLQAEFNNNIKYIKTYKKIGDESVPISSIDYSWSFVYDKHGIIVPDSAYVVLDDENITPNKFGEKAVVGFKVRPRTKYVSVNSIPSVYEQREVTLTGENYVNYLNWSRIIFDDDGNEIDCVKITEEYLREQGLDINSSSSLSSWSVKWTVKYTRSELVMKEITDVYGNTTIKPVYNAPEITPSKSFEKYLKFGGAI